jgi:D-alanyl-D-alanine carboxypeptidase/D-alanyl-D-alanine-endopeptidase (penicillin-binding protein 4)
MHGIIANISILEHQRMRSIGLRAGLFLLLTFISMSQSYAVADLPSTVLAALRQAGIPLKSVGIVVRDVDARQPTMALNPAIPFSPASTMKLLTTDAALELLGPTYTWKTQAYITGDVNGDVLNGNLIFKGSGDPKLVTENFWLFLRQIRAAGIRDIRGNVLLDRSAFEAIRDDSASFDGDPIKPYNAVPDALLLNYQSLRFQFVPSNAGGAATVLVDPPLANYDITAPAWTNGDCGDWQGKLGANISPTAARFTGRFSSACGEKNWYLRPYQMSANQYFAAIFKKMWGDVGGTFSGNVIDGLVTPDARPIATWESPTLAEVIRDINKFSNNVMARQLLLTLSSAGGNSGDAANVNDSVPASTERGAQAIKSWLAYKGIDAPELVIDNGSGLSRSERIAPSSMGDLLVQAFRSPMMAELIASLPLVGYDGTMRHRLNSQDVAGNAHVKTGTLNDVKAVAGYVTAQSGKHYVVVFFVNHPNAPNGGAAQDALLEWVFTHG